MRFTKKKRSLLSEIKKEGQAVSRQAPQDKYTVKYYHIKQNKRAVSEQQKQHEPTAQHPSQGI